MHEEQLITEFHRMWDGFPGLARLINRKHIIIAANAPARDKGFVEGNHCTKLGTPEQHRGCKSLLCLKEQQSYEDVVIGEKIKGWYPITGSSDYFIHYTIFLK